jgi:CHASE2 domain-containing sensor protein
MVKFNIVRQSGLLKSALGAALAILCGLMLWETPPGAPWVNASYDYLFRFGAHAVTNRVSLILMDNEAFNQFHQTRGQPWNRALHAQLLNKLADDGAELVVLDSFFRAPHDPQTDDALANAMRRQRHVVLMAEQSQVTLPGLAGAQPILPCEPFLSAAGTNWGVANLDPDSDYDSIVRRDWPLPSPGPYPSLPETAARLAGVQLSDVPQERWLRYYGQNGAWKMLSYQFALTEPAGYFRDQIVFIGTQPQMSDPSKDEPDKFRTPYTRWTGESSGGVEIILTSFLNLVNGDWLRRPAWWAELLTLIISGTLLGGGLCRLRLPTACVSAAAIAIVIAFGTISWSYFTNYWFPWLVIVGGQLPCALAWTVGIKIYRTQKTAALSRKNADTIEELPDIPGYKLFNPPFGEGAYGKVWLARNASGQWRALKVIYLSKFGHDMDPYEREFNGISRYKPVSDQHPGLLRVDFVSEKLDGYFYYIMELGDPLEAGWEHEPSTYKPRDLVSERTRAHGRRLPVKECVRIGLALTDALDFLHQHGLTHRDIKPQNIIFVHGHPKLADMGLTAEIRPLNEERTLIGTPGYMPPPPERPGTPQADIYALGMVLYVLSTGRSATFFPEIATSLVAPGNPADFFPLNDIILKACQPDPTQRYASAAEMRRALLEIQRIASEK